MVNYQIMTFGTGGNDGYVTPVSESYFQETFGYTYSPSYDSWVDYGGSPYYGDYYGVGQAYQYAATVPTTPTAEYQAQFQQAPSVPIAVGLHATIDKVADLGAIGDGKTVQMESNRFRTLTRTGKDTYSWQDTDANGNVIASGATRADGVSLTKNITFNPVSVGVPSVPFAPVSLVETGSYGKITTADIPNVGNSKTINISEKEYITVQRAQDGSYEYYTHRDDAGVTSGVKTLVPASGGSSPLFVSQVQSSTAMLAKSSPVGAPTINKELSIEKPALVFAEREVDVLEESIFETPDLYKQVLDEELRRRITPGGAPAGEGDSYTPPEEERLVIQEAAANDKGEGKEGAGDESAEEEERNKEAEEKLIDSLGKIGIKTNVITIEDEDSSFSDIMPEVLGYGQAAERAGVVLSSQTKTEPVDTSSGKPPAESLSDDPLEGYTGEEGKRRVTYEFLSSHAAELGITEKQAFTISTHFYPWASQMHQQGYNLGDLADLADWYDGLINGDPSAFDQLGSVSVRGEFAPGEFQGFFSLSPEQQRNAIKEFNQKLLERETPPQAIQLFNAGIYAKLGDNYKGDQTRDWMAHDGILHAISQDWAWNLKNDVKDFLASKEGQAAIGGGLVLAGIGIGFLAAGPAGAAVGAKFGTTAGGLTTAASYGAALSGVATLPFSLTELPQMFQTTPYLTKALLQEKGEYGKDRDSDANSLMRSTSDAINNLKFNINTDNILNNLLAIDTAKKSLEDYGNFIKKEGFLLLGAGTYDKHITEYNNLRSAFNLSSSSYGPDGVWNDPKAKATHAEFVGMREGYKVEFLGKSYEGKGTENSDYFKQPVFGVALVYDPDGKLIGSEKISLYADGKDKIVDIGSIIDQAGLYNKGGSATLKSGYTTITVPPRIKFDYEGKTYESGPGGTSYDIKRTQGAPLRITFESVDGSKKPLTEYIGYPDSGWNSYSVPESLKGEIGGSVQGFQTYLKEGQRLFWNDLDITSYIDKETGLVSMPGPGTYTLSVVSPDGTKSTKDFTLYANDVKTIGFENIPAKPFTPYQKSSGGSGGGGGGGGSSRRSSGSSYQKPVEQTLIKYGPTCEGTDIYQDEIRVYPEIDTPYSIDAGYHSIRIEKAGKKTWTKTVYCASGDTLTVSPAFEDAEETELPEDNQGNSEIGFPKRVFINSNPSAAKVLINGSASGEWTPCYFDLDKGYYIFTIQKTGYDPYDIRCYVGYSIMWNDQADAQAKAEGLI